VAIDGSRVLASVGRGDFLCGGEQRFDGLIAKHEQGGDRPQARRYRLIATRRADPLDDLFAAKLLQIISRLSGTIGGGALVAGCTDLLGKLRSGEAVG
jgi:hypothetical protein